MSNKTLAIGEPIQTRCTKCRKITDHIIVAMFDDRPSEVQCNTCKTTSPAKKPAVRRIADPKKSERDEWATLRPGMDTTRAKDYSMTTTYRAKNLVNHPIFGLGLVKKVTGPHKMAVLFADGQKIMRCN